MVSELVFGQMIIRQHKLGQFSGSFSLLSHIQNIDCFFAAPFNKKNRLGILPHQTIVFQNGTRWSGSISL